MDSASLLTENLNKPAGNHPAIDLGDGARRVSFQITTERTARKIQESIETFQKYGLSRDYDKLFFLILGKKKSLKCPISEFDTTYQILDISDLIREAKDADIDRLKELALLIQKEGLIEPLGNSGNRIAEVLSILYITLLMLCFFGAFKSDFTIGVNGVFGPDLKDRIAMLTPLFFLINFALCIQIIRWLRPSLLSGRKSQRVIRGLLLTWLHLPSVPDALPLRFGILLSVLLVLKQAHCSS